MTDTVDQLQSAEDLLVEDLVEASPRDKSPNLKRSGSELSSNRAVGKRVVRKREEPAKKRKKMLWQKGKLIGSGGFGKVYLGLDGNTGTLVAGKEFSFEGGNTEQKVKDLEQEMKLMQKLNHRHIVKYYGADRRDQMFYIFMEYVPGGSLRSILDQFGPLQDRVASRFTKQILNGLGYLHYHQVIHRDIKCANVLVNVDGVTKLADFGSAQFFTEASGTHGTPFWMPPEVIRGENVGWQADIWSLGCSIIEMMTGDTPFKDIGSNMKILYYIAGSDPIQLSDKISNLTTRDFIMQCLQRDPSKRPSVATLLNHDFITMFTRRLGTGDSAMSLMSASTSTSHHNAIVRATGGESPQRGSNDLEVESLGGTSLSEHPGHNNSNPLNAPIPTRGSTGGESESSQLSNENLAELGEKELPLATEEDEDLDDDVRSALVSRAMSFAGGVKGQRVAVGSSNNNELIQMIGDGTSSVALRQQPKTQSMGNVPHGGVTISGSESVLTMMAGVIEVDKDGVIEIDLEDEIETPTPAAQEGTSRKHVAVPMAKDTDELSDSSSVQGGTRRKGCMTTMQRLQLTVTLLLIGVIGVLAALLALN